MNFAARCALALGSLGALGLATACGAPTDAGSLAKTDTAFSVGTPIVRLPPALDNVTGAPYDNGATCGSTTVSPPTSLADFDCSWGVEVLQDPNLSPSIPPVTAPTGEYVQAYLWACLAVSPSGASIDATLATVAAVDSGTGVSAAFGGPAVTAEIVAVETLEPSYSDSCVGVADANYILVEETFNPRRQGQKPGGCGGNDCGNTSGGSGGGTGSSGITTGSGPVFQM